MGLKHILQVSQYRPSRHEARFVLKYLRYHDQRTYRAISKLFRVRYGIQAEEWADSLTAGGKFQAFYNVYSQYMPRHDYGRHWGLIILFVWGPVIYFGQRIFYWYHGDSDAFRHGTEFHVSRRRYNFSV